MLNSIITNLFVICVYIIPGAFLFIGLLLFKPDLATLQNEKVLSGLFAIFLALPFEVVVHAFSSAFFYPIEDKMFHTRVVALLNGLVLLEL